MFAVGILNAFPRRLTEQDDLIIIGAVEGRVMDDRGFDVVAEPILTALAELEKLGTQL